MITDPKTNIIYLSEWTKRNFPSLTKELIRNFKDHVVQHAFLNGTDDYYCRDYMPGQNSVPLFPFIVLVLLCRTLFMQAVRDSF